MIDLHIHILPGVDDGARDLDMALDMARVAIADGVTTVVATPHSFQWKDGNYDEMSRQLGSLTAALSERGLELRLLPGLEAFLTPDLPRQLESGEAFTLNGSRYLLVELPFEQYPPYTDDVLFKLQVRGVVPILAHPERNVILQKEPRRLFELVRKGVMAQVTAASVLGIFGSRVRSTAMLMLECGLVQFIASDAHSASGGRSPSLSAAVAQAAAVIGDRRAMAMVTDLPQAVVADREIECDAPRLPEAQRRWWLFWR